MSEDYARRHNEGDERSDWLRWQTKGEIDREPLQLQTLVEQEAKGICSLEANSQYCFRICSRIKVRLAVDYVLVTLCHALAPWPPHRLCRNSRNLAGLCSLGSYCRRFRYVYRAGLYCSANAPIVWLSYLSTQPDQSSRNLQGRHK